MKTAKELAFLLAVQRRSSWRPKPSRVYKRSGPTSGSRCARRAKPLCATNQEDSAAAGLSAFEGPGGRSTGCTSGEVRVSYDVSDQTVNVLTIVAKSEPGHD